MTGTGAWAPTRDAGIASRRQRSGAGVVYGRIVAGAHKGFTTGERVASAAGGGRP